MSNFRKGAIFGTYFVTVSDGAGIEYFIQSMSARNFVGIAIEKKNEGESIRIQIPGGAVDGNQSGLQPGQNYYVEDGALVQYQGLIDFGNADNVNPEAFVGRAVSDTTIVY
jgi:hypothetical protein